MPNSYTIGFKKHDKTSKVHITFLGKTKWFTFIYKSAEQYDKQAGSRSLNAYQKIVPK